LANGDAGHVGYRVSVATLYSSDFNSEFPNTMSQLCRPNEGIVVDYFWLPDLTEVNGNRDLRERSHIFLEYAKAQEGIVTS
jgi:hypothetical protein